MSRDVSDNAKEAMFAPQTGEAFIILITIDHPNLEEPIRITTDPMTVLESGIRGVISQTLEYAALPFEIVLPNEDEDSPPVTKLRMDNINRQITQSIREISSAPSIEIAIVLSSDPDTVEINITGFELNNVRADAFSVEAELTTERLDFEPFPPDRFTPGFFPGLFR